MKNKLLLHHHLGLGDHFICNGLVRYIYQNLLVNVDIYLPVLKHNIPEIKHLYKDININIIPINTDKEGRNLINDEWDGMLLCGNGLNKEIPPPDKMREMYPNGVMPWDHSFYYNARLNLNVRYTHSYVQRDKNTEIKPPTNDYIFIHEDTERGFLIDRDKLPDLPIVKVKKTRNHLMTDWMQIIENAKEVHCIDSSFLCFIDSFSLNENKYFHTYARSQGCAPTVRGWTII